MEKLFVLFLTIVSVSLIIYIITGEKCNSKPAPQASGEVREVIKVVNPLLAPVPRPIYSYKQNSNPYTLGGLTMNYGITVPNFQQPHVQLPFNSFQ